METLTARKAEIAGLAVASDEQIEAYILYVQGGEILSLRSAVDDGGAGLRQLVSQVRAQGLGTLRFPRVHPAEFSTEIMETLGFHPGAGHRLYATRAGTG